jgi:hypothetical protein
MTLKQALQAADQKINAVAQLNTRNNQQFAIVARRAESTLNKKNVFESRDGESIGKADWYEKSMKILKNGFSMVKAPIGGISLIDGSSPPSKMKL